MWSVYVSGIFDVTELCATNTNIDSYIKKIKRAIDKTHCKIDPFLIFDPCIYTSVIYQITYEDSKKKESDRKRRDL